jgi:hypothetical protein
MATYKGPMISFQSFGEAEGRKPNVIFLIKRFWMLLYCNDQNPSSSAILEEQDGLFPKSQPRY